MDDYFKLQKKDWERLFNAKPLNRTHDAQIKDIIRKVDFNYFIDCGPGSVGSEAWSVRDYLPDCKIVGLEPQNERFELLSSNGFPGELYKVAVSDMDENREGCMGTLEGKSDFWLHGEDVLIDKGYYKKEVVKCVTIDSIINDETDKDVFIWADIEGSEMTMLRGATSSIEKGLISGFNLELRDKPAPNSGGCTRSEVFDFLYSRGFRSLSGNNINGTHKDFIFCRED